MPVRHCSQPSHFLQSQWFLALVGPRSSPSNASSRLLLLTPSEPIFQYLNIIPTLKLMGNYLFHFQPLPQDVSLTTSTSPTVPLSRTLPSAWYRNPYHIDAQASQLV